MDLAGPEVGAVWDLCLSVEYDRDRLVHGLTTWLGPPDGLQVLDCACGSGFPALDLHRLGYLVTCTDGSPFMLERFRRNAERANAAIEPRQARWEELADIYPERFDAVICRGNSFLYAGTFETDADPDWTAVERSAQSFVRCLRSGGRLYVDATPEEELYGPYPQVTEHEPRIVDGHRIELSERLTAEPEARIRRWRVRLSVDGVTHEFERRSHFVPQAEFVRLLEGAGLVDVERVEIAGERYAVYVGRHP